MDAASGEEIAVQIEADKELFHKLQRRFFGNHAYRKIGGKVGIEMLIQPSHDDVVLALRLDGKVKNAKHLQCIGKGFCALAGESGKPFRYRSVAYSLRLCPIAVAKAIESCDFDAKPSYNSPSLPSMEARTAFRPEAITFA